MRPCHILLAALFIPLLLSPTTAAAHPHLLATASGAEISYQQLLTELSAAQVVFVGELHDHAGHHRMQYEIIHSLEQRQQHLAIGLEMIQIDDQPTLDAWVAGNLEEPELVAMFNRNWSMWPLYRDIFVLARERRIPLLALNISRDIIRQVARNGFDSLPSTKLEGLEGVTCTVDPAYEQFIRRALGEHGHNPTSFRYFCEAQLLWDTAMAKHLNDFLTRQPDYQVVVLAGSGHSWKYGIPHQLTKLAPRPFRVLLPEVPGRIDRTRASVADTDFLWLDVGPQSWTISPPQRSPAGEQKNSAAAAE